MNFKQIFILLFFLGHSSIYCNITETRKQELNIEISSRWLNLSTMGDEIAKQEKIVDSILADAIIIGKKYASSLSEKERKQYAEELIAFGQQSKEAFDSSDCNLLFQQILNDNVNKSPMARMKFAIIRRTIAVGILMVLQETFKEYLNETLKLMSELKQLEKMKL
ncbi:MAG: hypothetical protein BWY54_00202 [Candidatus Dependentiae bacterium ADurb.Bin331]|nr:MAG: hypothetical protein BWY54_00202 [Candidatus Dependentiae bacterium ADurb.Bin331]